MEIYVGLLCEKTFEGLFLASAWVAFDSVVFHVVIFGRVAYAWVAFDSVAFHVVIFGRVASSWETNAGQTYA